ncbi:MAG: hypothetical protein NHB14_16920 [Desulfosporosinus sp.]|nr:hypothetical protein [Desulfosporosinus sp.]
MPSYDLVCQSCGHKFSIFCTISQKDQQSCLICGEIKLNSGLQRSMSWGQVEIKGPKEHQTWLLAALAEQAAKRETVCFF